MNKSQRNLVVVALAFAFALMALLILPAVLDQGQTSEYTRTIFVGLVGVGLWTAVSYPILRDPPSMWHRTGAAGEADISGLGFRVDGLSTRLNDYEDNHARQHEDLETRLAGFEADVKQRIGALQAHLDSDGAP